MVGSCGSLPGTTGIFWIRRAGEHCCLSPHPLLSGERSPIQCSAYLQYEGSMFPATLPRAFFLQTKRTTKIIGHHHTYLASLLGVTLDYQASAPDAISSCPSPVSFSKLPRTVSLYRGLFFIRPLSVQQTKERLYREGWGAVVTLQGKWEFFRPAKLVSAIVYLSLHLRKVSEGSIKVLWPFYKIAVAHSGHNARAHFSLK